MSYVIDFGGTIMEVPLTFFKNNLNYKILDFVDMFVLSVMKVYENLEVNSLKLPILKTYRKD